MRRLALIAALTAFALPAAAQQGTITPYGGSIYGGPPDGYSFQFQNNSVNAPNAGMQWLQQLQPPTRTTTCTTFGNQTTCY
jgi:hypothetical protein